MAKTLCFGAVLWDIIEGHEYIGGAPFNLACHLAKQGEESYIFTCLGNDRLGENALGEIKRLGVRDSYVKRADVETGTAVVTLDENKVPSYFLPDGVSYQNIAVGSGDISEIRRDGFDLFYFGSFEQKGKVSRNSLDTILENCSFKEIFLDVNIRLGYYPKDRIEKSLSYSTIVKLNGDEVALLGRLLYGNEDENAFVDSVFRDYPQNRIILVTKGADGCTVYLRNGSKSFNECISEAVDTVGAGDAFSAGFIHEYLMSGDVFESTRRGNILADYVASRHGAIPDYDDTLNRRLA